MKWEELKTSTQQISFKRFTQKRKEPPAEEAETSEPATDAENDIDSGKPDAETRIRDENSHSKKLKKAIDPAAVRNKLDPAKKSRKSSAPEEDLVTSGEEADDDADDDEEGSESIDGDSLDGSGDEPEIDSDEPEIDSDEPEISDDDKDEAASDDEENDQEQGDEDEEDSECSLNESDLERLRKKPKKKRKHVLTLQRWRDYKRKQRLAKQQKMEGQPPAVPVKRERKKRSAPVDELTRRRQVIASELKRKLKESIANPRKKKRKKTLPVESLTEEWTPTPARAALPEPEERTPTLARAALPEPEERTPTPARALPEPEEPAPAAEEDVLPTPEPDPTPMKLLPAPPIANLSSESKPSPFDRGIKLRGRKLRKKFNGRVFRGEVADYDRRNRHYKVRYEDGDEEQLMWKDLGPLLVPFEELHTWDDPSYHPQQKRLISAELLKVEKNAELPKLTPRNVK